MGKINNIEKGAFVKLFNRGGYVLDFSTPDFDAFTMNSIGVALCQKYGLSKGKSLISYTDEAGENEIIKLCTDLLQYYETLYPNYANEIENNKEIANLYGRCKSTIARINSVNTLIAPSIHNLKEKFSSEYISAQIELMIKMQSENPTEAIGKAKELIESCCKTILEDKDVTVDKNWDINKLVDETAKLLKLNPKDIPDNTPEITAIKAILGNLKAIASNVANLRNSYGSGHGKSAKYKGLEERHAKLAVGSSVTLVSFLWDSHEKNKLS